MKSFGRRRFLALAAGAMVAACKGGEPAAVLQPVGAPSAPAARQPSLVYVPGSTVKVEQIVGDFDKERGLPTVNQTGSRYGIAGTDLGNSFEHVGKVYFPFGDSLLPNAPDPLGFSDSTDPEQPLRLDFLSRAPGTFTPISPAGVSMGPYEIPVAGISLDGIAYVVVYTNFSPRAATMRSVLTRFDEDGQAFVALREISHLPGGRFLNMTLRLAPVGLPGLPGDGPQVLAFGSGEYRRSNAYLSVTPAGDFVGGENVRYFAGMKAAAPAWTDQEEEAQPIVTHPTIGDLSVTYLRDLGLWLMTYDSRNPQGIVMRYAAQPWGPWSEAAVIFNARRDEAMGKFIHDPRAANEDGLAGPVATDRDPGLVSGGAYAPYIIERFTRLSGDRLNLHYLTSTWNPYAVVRMRSTFTVQYDTGARRT